MHRALPFVLFVLGCGAMGMDRGPIVPRTAAEAVVFDDARIQAAMARRPQLPERVRVAVWFQTPPTVDGEAAFRWDFEERERVVDAAKDLEGIELFPIAQTFVTGTDLASLRLAAAEHGANALLVVGGSVEQESDDNAWIATYPLVVPILFAPANRLETRFHTAAAIYDVGNSFLYVTAEAEAVDRQRRAHLWTDREEGIDEAKPRSIERLAKELTARLAHLTGQRVPSARRARVSAR